LGKGNISFNIFGQKLVKNNISKGNLEKIEITSKIHWKVMRDINGNMYKNTLKKYSLELWVSISLELVPEVKQVQCRYLICVCDR